ncbi:hypothetical protein Nepgr_025459 [Nepenthes gracilis]|uniref:Uncharacterized protein n=1 Tax=Nepenthes gracilis TaxID=150966 RepID=A0AAD3T7V5_NEPGR|nr:hypothetical protein Nepgr_025459 [Nepenthes gracilis]
MLKHRLALYFSLSVLLLLPLSPSTAEARPLNGGTEVGSVAGKGGDKGGKVGFVGRFSFESTKMAAPSLDGSPRRFKLEEAISGPSPGDGGHK